MAQASSREPRARKTCHIWREEGEPEAQKLLNEWSALIELEEVNAPTAGEVRAERVEKTVAQSKQKTSRLDALAERFENFERFAKNLTGTIGTAVEIANVMIAVQELREAKAESEHGKKFLSAIGAVTDLIEHGAGVADLACGARMDLGRPPGHRLGAVAPRGPSARSSGLAADAGREEARGSQVMI